MKKPRRLLRWLLYGFVCFVVVGGSAAIYGYQKFKKYSADLPSLLPIERYHPALATRVYDRHERLIGEFFTQKRIYKPIGEIPIKMQLAFIAAEDKNFYHHHGVDYEAIARAGMANFRAGRVIQGGSTITQQVVKMLVVGNERKFDRKIREALLAEKLETHATKSQILEVYLNQVYLGHGAYGVAAAAEVYFEKMLDQLTLGEMTMLASLTKAPARDSPYHNYRRAKTRQEYVVGRMMDAGYLNATEAFEAISGKLNISAAPVNINNRYAPHFVEFVRRELKAKYGDERLYTGGLEVHTTLDLKTQQLAEKAVKTRVVELNQDYRFVGPIGETKLHNLAACLATPKVVKGKHHPKRKPIMYNQRLNAVVAALAPRVTVCVKHQMFELNEDDSAIIRDWLGDKHRRVERGDRLALDFFISNHPKRYQTPKKLEAHLARVAPIEASAIVIEPSSGNLLAMVGGSDFTKSEWNRVVQAHRQAGSSIKPFIYSAALEHNFTEMSLVSDAPIAVKTLAGWWQPKNYKKEYLGPITLRTALMKSINMVSIRLVQAIGLDDTIAMMKRMGLHSDIPYHISISLGTPDVTLMDMAYAYSVFPNAGLQKEPTYIKKIIDPRLSPNEDGYVVFESESWEPKKVLDNDTAYIMVDMMKAVVQQGTGRKARYFPFTDDEFKNASKTEREAKTKLMRPVGGKTGTSTDFRDAWFIGYTTDELCGIWVGRDDFTPIGFDATGGKIALPIWMDIMKEADASPMPLDWTVPTSVDLKYIDLATRHEMSPKIPGGTLIPFRKIKEKEEENLK